MINRLKLQFPPGLVPARAGVPFHTIACNVNTHSAIKDGVQHYNANKDWVQWLV